MVSLFGYRADVSENEPCFSIVPKAHVLIERISNLPSAKSGNTGRLGRRRTTGSSEKNIDHIGV
jgi:hypothetical protein